MYKVAIIGAGSMANEHAKVFSSFPTVRLAGIYSRTIEKAEKLAQLHKVAGVCDSVSNLYEKTKADLVIIAVPELAASAVCREAFKHPWKVLMEKPAGYDLQDATSIYEAANQKKSEVLVGFNRRFYSSVLSIQSQLKENETRHVHIQDQQSYEEARAYNHPEKVVEKFMYANSIHNIDLIFSFCRGDPKVIKPIKPWQGEKTEHMLSFIEFDSGDTALYEGVWSGPGPWSCSVSTPKQRWVMQPLETVSVQKRGERKRTLIEIDPIDTTYKAGFYRQAEAILKFLQGQTSKVVNLSESLRTMKLIHQMFGV